MTEHPNRTAVVATWVRIGLVALAVPQAVTGLWAILDPSGWFTEFPGFDPRLVAADPPYNAHLANDTGAGFLATAVALSLAAWWGSVVPCTSPWRPTSPSPFPISPTTPPTRPPVCPPPRIGTTWRP
jgi:hypothetical protein